MAWFGFWIFAAACVLADAWLYSKGHDGLIFRAKTDAEKAIQHRQAYGVYQPAPRDPQQVYAEPKTP